MGKGKGSSSKSKSFTKERNKISSKLLKKKSRRKESKVLRHPDSDISVSSKSTWSTSPESDYRTRKNKSKKRRRDDLASSYSDDYSMTSASDSLYTHDDKSYKIWKALPQGRKKMAKKRFESADSNAEARRRKRSSRHHVVKSRNKPLEKKSRKHFTSSSSSDSGSYSTCDSSSSSMGDGRRRRSKIILDKEIKSSRGRESHRAHRKNKIILDKEIKSSRGRESHRAHRKRKARYPSGSSCSRCRDHDISVEQSGEASDHDISVDRSDEALVPVDNSRRLKSVIAIVTQPTDEEEIRWEKDPQKEEIVCDHDDYPSPKSMDSNEGVNRKESDDQLHGASNKKIRAEKVESEVFLMKSGNIGSEGYNADESQSHEVHTNSSENEKEIHVSVNFPVSDGDKKDGIGNDLELVLRQKALENLRRFKGGHQARQSINLDIKNENANQSSISRNENIQNKSIELNSSLAQETLPEVKKDSDAEQTATDPPEARAVFAVNDTNQAPGEHCSKAQRNESRNGSEFEQKTMSVMRGGEMVQVSYKVYIPKRAPALSRRQLRR